jgi:paraquat-inducible protein B
MTQRANYFKLGLFVLSTVAMLVFGLILFGLREAMSTGVILETCFDQTVQGLSVGSDVKYRGVKIGTVRELHVLRRAYPEVPEKYGDWILVRSSIDPEAVKVMAQSETREELAVRVQNGLRVFLSPQGITGLVFIELDYLQNQAGREKDGGEELIVAPWKVPSDTIYVPGNPGFLKNFMDSTQAIADGIESLIQEDLPMMRKQLTTSLDQVNRGLQNANDVIEKPEVAQLPERLDKLLANLDELTDGDQRKAVAATLKNVEDITSATLAIAHDRNIQLTIEEARVLVQELRKTASNADRALPRLADSIDNSLARFELIASGQQQSLNEITSELRLVLVNVRELTDELKKNPSLLIFSQSPKETAR